ncbi:MAG: hypothetical protein HS104_33435 [Polyangiaceae bacterium]|nr:hypothetical protein [Polyangiaceae bacterium]MCE7892851.1 hypothetical protein [Sorangiineae bacterium PRO1]MCL4753284.1 hypothetical protein [Myxococcales bacterium]
MRKSRFFITVSLLVGASAALGGGCSGKKAPGESGGASELSAIKVDKAPLEAASDLWEQSPEMILELLPQGVAFPMLQSPNVSKLKVRALRDGEWLALRLQWEDKTRSDQLEVDKFTDAVAVELPLGEPSKANPMMGAKGNPVYIAHWKAVWQRDVDKGRADVQDYHPNFWADTYPFVSLGHPYPVTEAFQSANQRRYLPGLAAGNPVSSLHRREPVEELQAEGFSTLADHRYQDARAKGVHKDGTWHVVIAVPLRVADPANPVLQPGVATQVAFAVWDGGAANVAGRKQWYSFVTLKLP